MKRIETANLCYELGLRIEKTDWKDALKQRIEGANWNCELRIEKLRDWGLAAGVVAGRRKIKEKRFTGAFSIKAAPSGFPDGAALIGWHTRAAQPR